MSKIDEIKERINRYKSLDQWRDDIEGANQNLDYINKVSREFESTGLSDREYLLSRLEIAEKALEGIVNDPVEDPYSASDAYNMQVRAEEALQQLRA